MFTVTRGLVSVCVLLQKRGSTSVTCVLTQPSAGLTSISTWPSTLSSWSTQTLSRSSTLLQLTLPSARTAPTTTGSDNRPTHNPLLFVRCHKPIAADGIKGIFDWSVSDAWFPIIARHTVFPDLLFSQLCYFVNVLIFCESYLEIRDAQYGIFSADTYNR